MLDGRLRENPDIYVNPERDRYALWLTREDIGRLDRLARRLDISESRVVGVALAAFENGLTVTSEGIEEARADMEAYHKLVEVLLGGRGE